MGRNTKCIPVTMIRKKRYSIDEVLSKRVDTSVSKASSKVDFDGDLIKMNSHRYETFALKGIACVACGIKGSTSPWNVI